MSSCTLVRSLDDLEPSTERNEACPAEMRQLRFADGTPFCIDQHEVTQADYQRFLREVGDARPDQALLNRRCDDNVSYEPSVAGECATSFRPADTPEAPVACVDLCDAFAYCAWAGKRMCGQRGGEPLDRPRVGVVTDDEWFFACTDGELARAYPYGESFDPTACAANGSGPIEVGSMGACRTDAGVFDMSGNVSEWSSACGNASDSESAVDCLTRGGSFVDTSSAVLSCASPDPASASLPLGESRPTLGIRCCKN